MISTHLIAEMAAPAQQMSDDRCKACFRHCILTVIKGVKEFAKGIKYATHPLSYSFWFLLCRVSADDLMESYMAAVLHKVQVLLGRDNFTPESILALNRDWKHHHLSKRVYVNLPFDKSANDYECYIGSTCRTIQTYI